MTIFLDVDGVLNQLQPWYLDKSCIKNLAELCKKLDATVTLTSSWRKGYNIKDYLILDDDISEFNRFNRPAQLYLVSSKTGLTSKDVKEIIKRFKH
jgi:hypothetical protein